MAGPSGHTGSSWLAAGQAQAKQAPPVLQEPQQAPQVPQGYQATLFLRGPPPVPAPTTGPPVKPPPEQALQHISNFRGGPPATVPPAAAVPPVKALPGPQAQVIQEIARAPGAQHHRTIQAARQTMEMQAKGVPQGVPLLQIALFLEALGTQARHLCSQSTAGRAS